MKQNLCTASSSRSVFSRKSHLISTIIFTLVITGSSLPDTARKRADKRVARGDTLGKPGVQKVPMGLTRVRGAFNKAIHMLADGAATNPRLARYYRAVTKRVKGRKASLETNSIASVPQGSDSGHSASIDADTPARVYSRSSADSNSSEDAGQRQEQRFTVGDLDFEVNSAVEYWTNYYSSAPGGRRTMMIGMERSSAFLEMARAEFRQAGVPEDLVWLAFVESVWNPQAVSPAAAGGLWQFIPATATDYGLKVQSGCDERNDPLKQTRVAATYLHDLYTIFGNWELSMAAYNSGEPRVMGAIVKNGRADFWELYDKQLLPKETMDYVPKILASIKVASQARFYGLS